jgi:enamine deaminase RidA (YjgF/YER057c/UK114 family)
MRRNIPGTSPYEPIIGFSRAVRVGQAVHVSGTGPVGADNEDAAAQTRHILNLIRTALERAGARLDDVVRTRMYLTHVEDWEAVGKAHGEFFGAIRPAATMVVVAALLNPNWRVEIEVDAFIDDPARAETAGETGARIRRIEEKAQQQLRNRPARQSGKALP